MLLFYQLIFSSLFKNFFKNIYMSFFILLMMSSSIMLKNNLFMYQSSKFVTLDNISLSLITLTSWMTAIAVMASSMNMLKKKKFFLFVLILFYAMMYTFMTHNIVSFFIMFELTLIPMLMLVIGFGYQPERISAGVYMMMYTMFGSMPLFIFILHILSTQSSLFMPFLPLSSLSYNMNTLWFLLASLGFLMKLPMYFIHLWLPKTHVEAPLLGSMILASILLKLGGYGLILTAEMFIYSTQAISIWSPLAMLGGVMISLLCFSQVDMKSIIAYSSVSHMSLVLGSIMTCSKWGLSSAITIMIGHGLCSSGLFFLANIMYERSNSRSLFMNKGTISYMPMISMWWCLFCVGNMAAPPTLNLFGEILSFISLINIEFNFSLSLAFMSFFGGAFSLYLFYLTQHGKGFTTLQSSKPNTTQELLNLTLHWLPLNIMLVMMGSVLL